MSRHLALITNLPLAAVPVAFLTIAACSTVSANPSAEPASGGASLCADTSLPGFAGRPASQALAAEILAASGASSLRWVQPGMAVTMDFRPERVTVHLDSRQQVERAVCG